MGTVLAVVVHLVDSLGSLNYGCYLPLCISSSVYMCACVHNIMCVFMHPRKLRVNIHNYVYSNHDNFYCKFYLYHIWKWDQVAVDNVLNLE